MKCIQCQKEIAEIDIAISKLFLSKGATEFSCIDCLSRQFKVSKELLLEKARKRKQLGCLLFENIEI